MVVLNVKVRLTLDAAFSTRANATPGDGTRLLGSVFDDAGQRLPPGTVIEAYAGDTRCGLASMPQTVMTFNDPDGFTMIVAGPNAIAPCVKGAQLSFRVNGAAVPQTATNTLSASNPAVTLVVP